MIDSDNGLRRRRDDKPLCLGHKFDTRQTCSLPWTMLQRTQVLMTFSTRTRSRFTLSKPSLLIRCNWKTGQKKNFKVVSSEVYMCSKTAMNPKVVSLNLFHEIRFPQLWGKSEMDLIAATSLVIYPNPRYIFPGGRSMKTSQIPLRGIW